MTADQSPPAAAQIVRDVVNRTPRGDDPLHVREIVAALHAAGWLHDPAAAETASGGA